MQPCQAYSFIQAGHVHSEIKISQYIKHPANVTTVGRSGTTTKPVPSSLIPRVSPCPTTIQVGSPPPGATARLESPPPPTAGPVDSPSIVLRIGPSIPTLRARSNKDFFSSSDLPSRSPSPDAEQLISSLANYQTLSDDALYDVALKAQQAMVKWQNEYKALQKDLTRMSKPSRNTKVKTKPKPRELEKPLETNEKHHDDSLNQPTPNVTQSSTTNNPSNTPQTTGSDPIEPLALKSRHALSIDMTASMQPLNGKRIRKPRVLGTSTAVSKTAPRKSTKRPRDPETDSLADQPRPKNPKREVLIHAHWTQIPTAKSEAEELTSAAEIAVGGQWRT